MLILVRVTVGDEVQIECTVPIADGIHVGLLQGDADIIKKLLPATKYAPATLPGLDLRLKMCPT